MKQFALQIVAAIKKHVILLEPALFSTSYPDPLDESILLIKFFAFGTEHFFLLSKEHIKYTIDLSEHEQKEAMPIQYQLAIDIHIIINGGMYLTADDVLDRIENANSRD